MTAAKLAALSLERPQVEQYLISILIVAQSLPRSLWTLLELARMTLWPGQYLGD
jgi:hypothetical protein